MAQPTLLPILIQSYSSKLHTEPERGSLLMPHVRVDGNIEGMTHHLPVIGKAIAGERGPSQPVMPDPVQKARPSLNLANREHWQFIDRYQNVETNVELFAKFGTASRMACDRACDQMILNALDNVNAQAFGTMAQARPADPGVKVSVKEIAKACTALLQKGVSLMDNLVFIYSEAHFTNIVGIDQLISRDYSERGLIRTGRIPSLFGIQWVGVETRIEGGIPENTGYLIAKEGIALGLLNTYGNSMQHNAWRDDVMSWQIGATFAGGSTAVDKGMLTELNLDATVT